MQGRGFQGGPWAISITWQLVRNADFLKSCLGLSESEIPSWDPTICVLTGPLDDSDVLSSLRATGIGQLF